MYCAGTNGHISCWDLSFLVKEPLSLKNGTAMVDHPLPLQTSDGPSRNELYWNARKATHQSSVKAMFALKLVDSETLVVSGGDDNALALTRFSIVPAASSSIMTSISTLRIPKAHASAITAAAIIPIPARESQPWQAKHRFLVITSGNDQRVKLWDVVIDLAQSGVAGIRIQKRANKHTSVADVSSMDVFVDNGVARFALCGVGMEIWTLEELVE